MQCDEWVMHGVMHWDGVMNGWCMGDALVVWYVMWMNEWMDELMNKWMKGKQMSVWAVQNDCVHFVVFYLYL